MADVTVSGLDELTLALQKAGELTDDVVSEMLYAAGDIIVDAIRKEMRASRFAIDGLLNNVGYKKTIKRNKNGDPYITVTVTGKTSTGNSAATVLFVLNYGRSKKYGAITPGYFWTLGSKQSESAISKKLEEIAQKHLREGGLL